MKVNKRKFSKFILSIAACAVCLAVLVFGFRFFSARAQQIDQRTTAVNEAGADQAIDQYLSSTQRKVSNSEHIPDELILVNDNNPIPADYMPNLKSIGNGHSFDKKAAPYLMEMLSDAKNEGLSPMICSSYRTEEEQTKLFKNKVSRLMKSGMNYQDAFDEAKRTVALPGRSEHNVGYAVDIVSTFYTELDEDFAYTQEAIWLEKNCHKYGFILRYPEEKTDITNIIYEPWHFRYVGKDAAKEMKKKDLCLEEYIEQKYDGEQVIVDHTEEEVDQELAFTIN